MGAACRDGQYLDVLTRSCVPCGMLCQEAYVVPICASYCESALCHKKLGHYYDRLLRRCLWCSDVCGKHPAECAQHCSTSSPPVTTQRLLGLVSRHSRPPPGLMDSGLLLPALLAVCVALLLSSLVLAVVVLLRGGGSRGPPAPEAGERRDELQPGEKAASAANRAATSPGDFPPSLSYSTHREPSEDSNPTETCVCVHCFPDLKALGQSCDGLHRVQ